MKIFTDELLLQFNELMAECGDFMLSASLAENNPSCVKKKSGDADFVTIYDEGVQAKLIDGLLKIFPDAHFFAEEKENFAEDTENGLCFVIDPIDGTTNFIHNLGASAVSVALLCDGELVFGAVYDPYRKELFTAFKGGGAYMNGNKISVSARELDTSVIAFGTTPYKKNEYSEKGFDIARKVFCSSADIRRSGSAALDMAYVACGKLDGFFECVLSPWDYAAGALLIEEAGGSATDFYGNMLEFAEPSSVLCSNNVIHNKLIALINK